MHQWRQQLSYVGECLLQHGRYDKDGFAAEVDVDEAAHHLRWVADNLHDLWD